MTRQKNGAEIQETVRLIVEIERLNKIVRAFVIISATPGTDRD